MPREAKLSRVVALGGGTGLAVVLRALRQYLPAACRITAVVTASDSGGSSGALRNPVRRSPTHPALPHRAGDYRLVNTSPIPPKVLARYEAEGAEPVRLDLPSAAAPRVVAADLLDSGPVLRRATDRLGPILCDLAAGRPERATSEARG